MTFIKQKTVHYIKVSIIVGNIAALALLTSSTLLQKYPFFYLLSTFQTLLFLPLLFTLPLALIFRGKSTIISTLCVVFIFAGLYGSQFLPQLRSVSNNEQDVTLRIMTFNTGLHLSDPEIIKNVILQEKADIVALQEASPSLSQLLREDIVEHYPHQIMNTPNETTVLLSRYPIRESAWLKSHDRERASLYAKVEWNREYLQVFAVHPLPASVVFYNSELPIPLGLHDFQQQEQIRNIMNYSENLSGWKLILGDFNMSEQAEVYSELTNQFQDAYREAGWGFGHTFPNKLHVGKLYIGKPLVRLDFIFHSCSLQTLQSYVRCRGGSDHCYVIAEISAISP